MVSITLGRGAFPLHSPHLKSHHTFDDDISNTNIQPDQLSCSDHRGLFSWAPMLWTYYGSYNLRSGSVPVTYINALSFTINKVLMYYRWSSCRNHCLFVFNRYEFGQSIINTIFGPKAHIKFPRLYRLDGAGCKGQGFYPALLKSGNPEYPDEGVDLEIEPGDLVSFIKITLY
jgi:hypothetical protein